MKDQDEWIPQTRMQQFRLRDLIGILKRRWKVILIPPVIVTAVCVGVAYNIPRMYESSIHLLVQRNQMRNPFAPFVPPGSDDELRSFNEIINSTQTMERLVDSLGLRSSIKNEVQRRAVA